MNLKDLKNKKIAFLGLGIENLALINFLLESDEKFDISIFDGRDAQALGERYEKLKQYEFIKWYLGNKARDSLKEFDILFRSAGWPIFDEKIKEALKAKTILSSAIKLFFDLSPTENIIGVTGTKGKGTTSGLIVSVLKTAGKKVFWGGNVGIPVFSFLKEINKDDFVVLELSSFQLEDLERSPRFAIITNFFPEHLSSADPLNPNYHKSLEEYCRAKLNLIRFQTKDDWAVLNSNLKESCKIKGQGKLSFGQAKKIYFQKSNFESNLFGEYNKENIGAVVEMARILKIREAIIKKGIKKFKALPHRMEFVGEIQNRKYYDNSFATTPEATIADLNSFQNDLVLLLGGADKGSDFKDLALKIKEKVKFVILFKGEGSERIYEKLKNVKYKLDKIRIVDNMKDAVKTAIQESSAGDTILLSPACASFGIFKNYKERGNLFKEQVLKIRV